MTFQPREIVASAARTTAGDSGALFPGADGGVVAATAKAVALAVDVTAVSGAGATLALTVEWSNDGTTWHVGDPVDEFTDITATGSVVKRFDVKAQQYRLVWAITGTTPSFTFAVTELAQYR